MNDDGLAIVGIGASAGGMQALQSFLAKMPDDSGMAFVVILHLPADHKSLLPEILTRWTSMTVVAAEHGMAVRQNRVYVPPPHAIVELDGEHLAIYGAAAEDQRAFRPIDGFFDSLSAALRERAVGIVLSGTGIDGALGLKAIRERGGLTIAQGIDGTAPQYGEMPSGAMATGAVDIVAPVEEIPQRLLRMLRPQGRLFPLAHAPAQVNAARLEICTLLRAQLGHDFSGYRDKTFLRRVARRMQLVNASTLDDYIRRLRIDPQEVIALFRDLLIRVTSFFRDKETFEALEQKVMPRLFEGKTAEATLRVWVPGCATGEEAYSLAMLLYEYMEGMPAVPKVQVFATDIDDAAITIARLGRYPTALLEGLSQRRRKRFFKLTQGSYVVSKEIRDLCTFSAHNLVRDPPFSRMDLVSCRNLLIYMDVDLQASVIPVFHYSLVRGGILLLGGSEAATRHEELFEPLDQSARIFRRRDVGSPPLELPLQDHHPGTQRDKPGGQPDWRGTAGQKPAEDRVATEGRGHAAVPTATRHPLPLVRFDWPPRRSVIMRIFRGAWPSARTLLDLQHSLLRTREQLQSVSEEHQTALEELQSVNEELHTVNSRLSEKVRELDATNSDLRNLFESTEIATIFLDRELIVRSFTPAIATIYNLIPGDQGRPLSDIVSHLDYGGLRDDFTEVLRSLQPLERRVARADAPVHYIMRVLPYREPDSTVSGILVTFVDVSSVVRAEAALLDADAHKDVFLATLSHELRNPLAPIRSAARLLQSPDLSPQQLARAQSIIARQVMHMSSLLDDLLDVARITRGSFMLKREYVDVNGLLDAAMEAVQPATDFKQHTVRIERPDSPILLEVDPVRLTQVVSNLLTNSVKYTPQGGLITLGCRRDGDGCIIFVRDNGVGLAPAMLSKIFSMFTRVESRGDHSEGGLGIGLALARGLVELHGGRLEADSPGLGHGSEFTVFLPAGLIVAEIGFTCAEPVQAKSGTARRVLIADDNRDGAETLGMFLSMNGHDVHLAHRGDQALELANEFRPEVAILDIGMPGMTGYQVAQHIRHEAWGDKVTLIALTGWGQADDKRRARAAGFDHHLTKPIDPEHIETLFNRDAIP